LVQITLITYVNHDTPPRTNQPWILEPRPSNPNHDEMVINVENNQWFSLQNNQEGINQFVILGEMVNNNPESNRTLHKWIAFFGIIWTDGTSKETQCLFIINSS